MSSALPVVVTTPPQNDLFYQDSLDIASTVPLDDNISFSDLASKVGVRKVYAIEKQLRFAFLMGLFHWTPSRGVTQTALSIPTPASSSYISLRLTRNFCQHGHEMSTMLRNGAGKE